MNPCEKCGSMVFEMMINCGPDADRFRVICKGCRAIVAEAPTAAEAWGKIDGSAVEKLKPQVVELTMLKTGGSDAGAAWINSRNKCVESTCGSAPRILKYRAESPFPYVCICGTCGELIAAAETDNALLEELKSRRDQ